MRPLVMIVAGIGMAGLAGCFGESGKLSAARQARFEAARKVAAFVETGDTAVIGEIFADNVLGQMSPEGMLAVRSDLVAQNGDVGLVTQPHFRDSSEAHIEVHFENAAIDVTLRFDEQNKIDYVDMAPLAIHQKDDKEEGSGALGPVDLTDSTLYAEFFNSGGSSVRLVTLLSPT